MSDWQAVLQQRETDTHFVIEGRHAVERALDSSFEVEKVIEIDKDLTRDEVSTLLGFHVYRSHLAVARNQPPIQSSLLSETDH